MPHCALIHTTTFTCYNQQYHQTIIVPMLFAPPIPIAYTFNQHDHNALRKIHTSNQSINSKIRSENNPNRAKTIYDLYIGVRSLANDRPGNATPSLFEYFFKFSYSNHSISSSLLPSNSLGSRHYHHGHPKRFHWNAHVVRTQKSRL